MREPIVELGNWPNQSTWHIIDKATKLPFCNFKDLAPIFPFCQPIEMISSLPVCDDCDKLYTLGDNSMTLYDTVYLLSELTKRIPPGKGQRHNITLSGDTLQVTLMFGDKYTPVVLNNDDLYRRLDKLVDDICEMVKNANSQPLR